MTIRSIRHAGIIAVVSILALVPSAVAVTRIGSPTVYHPPTHLHDKNGVVTLRLHYSCTQYDGYTGSDVFAFAVNIGDRIPQVFEDLAVEYGGFTEVTCDGQTHKLTVDLRADAAFAIADPVPGPAIVIITHDGYEGPHQTGNGVAFGDDQVYLPVVVR